MTSLIRTNNHNLSSYNDDREYYLGNYWSIPGKIVSTAVALVTGVVKGTFSALFSPYTILDTKKTIEDIIIEKKSHGIKRISDLINLPQALEAVVGATTYLSSISLFTYGIIDKPTDPLRYIPLATNVVGGLIETMVRKEYEKQARTFWRRIYDEAENAPLRDDSNY